MESAPYTPIDPNATMPKRVKVIAILIMVVAPILYLVVVSLMADHPEPPERTPPIVYIMLAMAVLEPLAVPFLTRIQTNQLPQSKVLAMTPDQLYAFSAKIAHSFVGSSYLLGLFAFFVSWDSNWLYYFYPVGIVWSVIYWPTDAKYRVFLEKLRGNEPTVG